MEKILIQIASYRDSELMPTIESAISQAKYPERLVFAVCYQEKKGEEYERLLRIPACRVIQADPEDSRGTCWARHLTQSLWQGEEYTLQIDSHMRFVPEWDALAIEMLHQCPGKAILTAYCPPYCPGEPLKKQRARRMGADYFEAFGMLMFIARCPIWSESWKPVPGAFWSGHFSFSSGELIAEVPYDPELYFHGEEISYAVRAYTCGWDIYYPHIPLCYHWYSREDTPAHWLDHDIYIQNALSKQRVRRLLRMEPSRVEFGKYGLGTVRTLEEYERYSHVNFQKKSFDIMAWLGYYEEIKPIRNQGVPERKHRVLAVTSLWFLRNRGLYFNINNQLDLEQFSILGELKHLPLVCYCDDVIQKQLIPGGYEVRPIEGENTFWGKYLEQSLGIAGEPDFQENLTGYFGRYQGDQWAQYTLMLHCKANFLQRAKAEFPDYSHYIFLGFGCCFVPIDPAVVFDWSPWLDEKIHFQAYEDKENDTEAAASRCRRGNVIAASLFILPREEVDWYVSVYEEELKALLDDKILADDSYIMLKLARKYSKKITLEIIEEMQGLLYEAIP